MTRTTALLLASLSLACGDSGKTTDASATSDGTTSPGTTATGSTGAPSTTQATTTQATTTATTGPATTSGTTADTTSGTSTTTTTTGTSTTGTSTTGTSTTGTSTTGTSTTGTTGAACSDNAESCASGEKCCEGLECCAGVPIPPGMETCLAQCPDSDRNLKTEFAALDVHDVLRRVAALDITTWRYKKDAPGVRHLGPMAQDFKAAFGLGDTDRLIFPLDATGVSMAAIQALHHRLVAAEADNDDLRARLDRMDRRLADLEAR